MPKEQPNNPMHGITLEMIINQLVDIYGWEDMAERTKINFFKLNPRLNPSLTFLRKTPWARQKVEDFYLWTLRHEKRSQNRR